MTANVPELIEQSYIEARGERFAQAAAAALAACMTSDDTTVAGRLHGVNATLALSQVTAAEAVNCNQPSLIDDAVFYASSALKVAEHIAPDGLAGHDMTELRRVKAMAALLLGRNRLIQATYCPDLFTDQDFTRRSLLSIRWLFEQADELFNEDNDRWMLAHVALDRFLLERTFAGTTDTGEQKRRWQRIALGRVALVRWSNDNPPYASQASLSAKTLHLVGGDQSRYAMRKTLVAI